MQHKSIKQKKSKKIYPSIIPVDYDISRNNYNLEALLTCNAELWNNAFEYISEEEYRIRPIEFSLLVSKLQQCLLGECNFVGKSFADTSLFSGNIYSYYLQYLGNAIFKHPHVIEPFQNIEMIKENISNVINKIIEVYLSKENIIFLHKSREKNTKLKDNSQKFLSLEPGYCFEFKICVKTKFEDTPFNKFFNGFIDPVWCITLLLS